MGGFLRAFLVRVCVRVCVSGPKLVAKCHFQKPASKVCYHVEFLLGVVLSWDATERLFGLYVIQPSNQYILDLKRR